MSHKLTVIITSYKEPKTISQAIQSIANQSYSKTPPQIQLIVTAPDPETIKSAETAFAQLNSANSAKFIIEKIIVKDNAQGKPAALNLAHQKVTGEILVLTDGDMHISSTSIEKLLARFTDKKVGGVSGHPISLDSRKTRFGYYSHLFCEAANQKRLTDPTTPMSGYLYAFRNIDDLFPIPEEIRSEDAFISAKIHQLGYKTAYEKEALAYVKFPKNFDDWMKQKVRSLGGNVQIKHKRSILQDLGMILFPLKFAQTPKELYYSLTLYPLRLYLWLKIYLNHAGNKYQSGTWERIESSKS